MLSVAVAFALVAAVTATPFAQYNATQLLYSGQPSVAAWPHAPFADTTDVAFDRDTQRFFLLTTAGDLYSMPAAPIPRFTKHTALPPGCRIVPLAAGYSSATSNSSLLAVCPAAVYHCMPKSGRCAAVGPKAAFASVTSAAVQYGVSPRASVLVGTPRGLFSFDLPSGAAVAVPLRNTTGTTVADLTVKSVTCLPPGVAAPGKFFGASCVVATTSAFCAYNICPADLVHMVQAARVTHLIRVPGVIDAAPVAGTFDAERGAIHFAHDVCVNTMFANGTMLRVGGDKGGLPQNNLTSAATMEDDGTVWFGSRQGLMMRRQDGSWKYFFGPRWLPGAHFTTGMHVVALAVGGQYTVVATDAGIAVVRRLMWTLADKAADQQSKVMPFFDRFGLATASQPLRTFGAVESWYPAPSANDGLWTSMYLASQIFRFAATRDPAAKAEAWRSFFGMELLCNATGIKGMCARSVLHEAKVARDGWYPSPTMPGWSFEGNPSSDEVTGHLHVYPLMYDLVCETDAERTRVRTLFESILSNIVDHGLRLYDVTGKPTRWGDWTPATLNDNPTWYDGRGLNSMQILAFLSAGYRLTRNETYLAQFNDLVLRHGYGDNIVNLKITQPSDVNYSDDELTFLAYLCFAWSGRPAEGLPANPAYELVKARFKVSVDRTWQFVHKYRPALWGAIFRLAVPDAAPAALDAARADLRWCLETWPISSVRWPIDNAKRRDVFYDEHPDRSGDKATLLITMLPYDEISVGVLNGNPFRRTQGSGMDITNPSFYLYPFWLSRFLDM